MGKAAFNRQGAFGVSVQLFHGAADGLLRQELLDSGLQVIVDCL